MNIRQIPDSDMVTSIGFKAGVVVLAFKKGGVYAYSNVPTWLYAVLFRAKSMGRAIRKHLINNPAISCARVA